MDVALSDLLTCPRCGPLHGLILLPYELGDRRVRSGVLGCANCRERYVIESGVADLRVAGTVVGAPSAGGAGGAAEDEAVRLGALLGLAEARGVVLLAGAGAGVAGAVARLVPEVSVVVAWEDAQEGATRGEEAAGPESREISRIRVDRGIPFRSGSLAAVALLGGYRSLLGEGLRAVRRPGRVMVDPVPAGAVEEAEGRGAEVLLEEGEVLVLGVRT